MLRFEGLLDVLVELLVAAGGFGGVEIAAAGYVAVGSVEVEGGSDDVERREGQELFIEFVSWFDRLSY